MHTTAREETGAATGRRIQTGLYISKDERGQDVGWLAGWQAQL